MSSLAIPNVVCDNRCVSHKRGYLLQVKKWLFLLVELCYFLGNSHSLKALYKNNSENVSNGSQTVGLVFHELHRSRIFTKCT